MLLAIDAGNTNTVFALMEGLEIRQQWRISTSAKRTAEEYYVWLARLLEHAKVGEGEIANAILASVVPTADRHLVSLAQDFFNCPILRVGDPGVDLGIAVNLPNPAEVGADRLVNAIAGFDLLGGAHVIVDFGTATTFDVVGEDGSYEGGIISPGIDLSLKALNMAAAKLPLITPARPEGDAVIGKDTVSAMQSGVFWGYVGLIEGLVSRIRAEMGGSMPVIATGGLARSFVGHTDAIDRVERDLTLIGLRLIHERNVNAR